MQDGKVGNGSGVPVCVCKWGNGSEKKMKKKDHMKEEPITITTKPKVLGVGKFK